jgi:ABC-2 type transport system ATP-binding protein
MIEAQGLVKNFARLRAVDELSFQLKAGEVLGFLGPNGAGKSTTMRMLAGSLVPDAGKAMIGGFDIQQQPMQAKKLLGYLPEGAPANAEMSTLQFLQFIAGARGMNKSQALMAVGQAIEQLALADVQHQRIETLSKGYQRRLGLAAAILHSPPALILDEPTDGLDPNQKHQVRKLIQELSSERAILVSTHILEEVEAVCSRVIIISKGKKKIDSTPQELIKQSRYYGAVSVKVNDSIAARAALDGIPGLTGFTQELDGSLSVFSQRSTGLMEVVQERLKKREVGFSDIRSAQPRLDEVFRALTQEEGEA